MRPALLAALVLVAVPIRALAGPAPLASSVTRVPPEPPVVVTSATSGATVVERYRAHAPPRSGTPLVVIVRLPPASSPDVVAVSDAHRDGSRISIAIETRKYDGPLAGNEVTTPYVEVELGTLAAGSYTIEVGERVLRFTKFGAPETAGGAKPGLQSSISLTVR